MMHIACRLALSIARCSMAGAALAKNCSSVGNLSYVGRMSDASRSVWLSTVDPDNSSNFRLEAAQGSSTVDTFGPKVTGDAFRPPLGFALLFAIACTCEQGALRRSVSHCNKIRF